MGTESIYQNNFIFFFLSTISTGGQVTILLPGKQIFAKFAYRIQWAPFIEIENVHRQLIWDSMFYQKPKKI